MQLSATLPADQSQGLRLDAEHLPHITLTQHFVRVDELDAVLECVDETLRGRTPLSIHVTGGGKGGSSAWMVVERTEAIRELHERLMETLRAFERPGGGPAAFFEGEARLDDMVWVAGYRLKASLSAYAPHITLGHASKPPRVDPFTFEATAVAACHLGCFCSCRRVLRSWELG